MLKSIESYASLRVVLTRIAHHAIHRIAELLRWHVDLTSAVRTSPDGAARPRPELTMPAALPITLTRSMLHEGGEIIIGTVPPANTGAVVYDGNRGSSC